jgi:uncharacterized protein (TIGR02246 family)
MAESKRAFDAEIQIRWLINKWLDAIRNKDIDAVMSHYAPDVETFDIVPPLSSSGRDNYRKGWETWFSTIEGPVEYEMHDLKVAAAENVAFCHSVNRVSSVGKDGGASRTWLRATVGFEKVDGKWLVTHEHISVPFEMKTGMAALDLEP